jgi:hypothetical protein
MDAGTPGSGCFPDGKARIPADDGSSVSLPCQPTWTIPGLVIQYAECKDVIGSPFGEPDSGPDTGT